MKILLTGAAGFIGSATAEQLVKEGNEVVGIDNINDYYTPQLKYDRLQALGINSEAKEWNKPVKSEKWDSLTFCRMDIKDKKEITELFKKGKFEGVVHLAAQPGVRYSIENPEAYIENNVNGFLNILEGCRKNDVKHLVFASSSSVYGLNGKTPFSEKDGTSHPVSLYAATKKSNEMMAHSYSCVFGLPVTGLRFFTVYGPWGRPDMSPHLFIDAIMHKRPIKVFNHGDMWRDFTYIDDIVAGITKIIHKTPEVDNNWDSKSMDPSCSSAPYRIYNIGSQHPIRLIDYISTIEEEIGWEAEKDMQPMQPGDVYRTYADSSALAQTTGFTPCTSLKDGIHKTVEWYRSYYKV
ncbi:MAG: NAD-dependent epimerase [Muribaculaceae bacterium]|nr:NAD-dependent epimerase [Muribaculaceae bacterium]